jgi:hypothetical protein
VIRVTGQAPVNPHSIVVVFFEDLILQKYVQNIIRSSVMRDNREYCDGKLMECGKILKFMKSESWSIVTLNLHPGEISIFRSTEGAPGRSWIQVYVSAVMNNRSVLGSIRRTLRELAPSQFIGLPDQP